MNHKVGHYIVGGGHYDSHMPPPIENPCGISVLINQSHVDDLLEPHKGRIRVAGGLQEGVEVLPPDSLELCYIGIRIIKNFPEAYPRYLDMLEGYKDVKLIDENTINAITNMLERNMISNARKNSDLTPLGIGAFVAPLP